jgi:hypothetical protein
MMIRLNCKTFLICWIATMQTFAQLSPDLLSRAVQKTEAKYHSQIMEQSGLYNGSKYEGNRYEFKENGHPFFKSDKAQIGSVLYNGDFYPNILLHYDEVLDVLVFETSGRKIQLVNEKITSFSIGEDSFILFQEDENAGKATYFQLIYDGKVRALKKEVKSVIEDISSPTDGIKRYIKKVERYYIQKDNSLILMRRKKDLISCFSDQKKEIQKYLNDNNLSFKKDKGIFLNKVSEFYDELQLNL